MAKVHERITEELAEFIGAQAVFFVATAPLAGEGHVNLSPKGLDTLRVLDERRVAYLDLNGSGNETSAHLAENGRITLMFCAFSGRPQILRLYGRGRTILPDSPEWPALRGLFGEFPHVRQIIIAAISRVQTSCGFGVPLMAPAEPRDTLLRWAESKDADAIRDYQRKNNQISIDGCSAPLAGYLDRQAPESQ